MFKSEKLRLLINKKTGHSIQTMNTTLKTYNSSDPIVLKSNALIDAEYYLTLNQHRLLYSCLAQVKPKEPVKSEYVVYAKDYADTYGLEQNTAYEQLQDAVDSLYESEIVIDEIVDGKEQKRRIRWVYEAKYIKGQGSVTVAFSPTIIPHISELERDYVMLRLNMVKKFKKSYSFKLYEIACRYVFMGTKYFDLDELKQHLRISHKYKRWVDFERYVLKPSCEEVSKNTSKHLSYEVNKKGRRIVGVTLVLTDVIDMGSANVVETDEEKKEEPQAKKPKENDYLEKGYRSHAEYLEALSLEERFGIKFNTATDFINFRLKLMQESTKTSDLFNSDS